MKKITALESQVVFESESYSEMFWRHGKQLLKGAAVLGAGMLGYGAWRYIARETSVAFDENRNAAALTLDAPDTLSTVFDNEYSRAITWQEESNTRANTLPRRQANNCLAASQVGEFRVNSYTTSHQTYPALTTLLDGDAIMVWQSYSQDGSGTGVYGQCYAKSGSPLGIEFRVNNYTMRDQAAPVITTLQDGSLMVVWNSIIDAWRITGRHYDASGAPLGNEFQISNYKASVETHLAIAETLDGFVVAWHDLDQDSTYNIFIQHYSASGVPLSNQSRVNTYTAFGQRWPAIVKLSDNSLVVVWQSDSQDGSGTGIYGQCYTATVETLGSEFQVNTNITNNQNTPAVAGLADGGFVVVWQTSIISSGFTYGLFGQRYSSSGIRQGPEFQINTLTGKYQRLPVITGLSEGSFVVVWENSGQNSAYDGIYGQRYTALGSTAGSEFKISVTTTTDHPAIMQLPNEGFIVAWDASDQSSFNYDIYARYFRGEIFVGNCCDARYTEDTNYPLNLTLGALAYASVFPINVTLLYSPFDAGQFLNATNPANALWNNTIPGQWFATGDFAGIENVLAGLYFKPTLNYNQAVQLSLTISDGISNPFIGNFILNGIPVNDPPTLPFLKLSIKQGETIILNMSHVPVNDVDMMSDEVFVVQQAVSHGYLALTSAMQNAITIFSQTQLLANTVLFTHDGSQDAPTLILYATDGTFMTSPVSRQGDFSILLYLTANQLAINQGEHKLINADMISATNPQNSAASVKFIISEIQYGQFEKKQSPNVGITQFSLADIQSGNIYFVHDGSINPPLFSVQARQQQLYTPPEMTVISYNDAPEILRNNIIVTQRGQRVVLSLDNIQAVDTDNKASELIFYVRLVEHGYFAYTGSPNTAISSFTQSEIAEGIILFVQDNSNYKPAYKIAVSDGLATSAENAGDVTFNAATNNNIPFTETTGFKSGISIAITAVGTLVGFATWRYRNDQDAKRRRKQSIIANIIRTDLNLAGVHDFTSERGVQFLEAISSIIKQLDKIDIDVIRMAKNEQENFSHQLAKCLKTHVSYIPPQDTLEGNCVTSPTRHLYYQKVKPLFKPGVGWLDTDKVKDAAETIADQVKIKLNTVDEELMADTDDNTKSTLMQPLI